MLKAEVSGRATSSLGASVSYFAENAAILGDVSHAVTWRTEPTEDVEETFLVWTMTMLGIEAVEVVDAPVANDEGEDSVWTCFSGAFAGEEDGDGVERMSFSKDLALVCVNA